MALTLTRYAGLSRFLDGVDASRIRGTVTDGLPAGYALIRFPDRMIVRDGAGALIAQRYYPSKRVDRMIVAAALHTTAHAHAAWTERGE